MSADKPVSPWREKPYTIVPNSYLLRLAGSNLTGRAISALLVILTETRGAPGQTPRQYGKEASAVSAADVARSMGCSTATARRAVTELLAAGWVRVTEHASGRRGSTITPLLHQRRKLEPVPAEPEAEPGGAEIARAWLEEKQLERRESALRRARGESA